MHASNDHAAEVTEGRAQQIGTTMVATALTIRKIRLLRSAQFKLASLKTIVNRMQ
jgi:hypothetical protein